MALRATKTKKERFLPYAYEGGGLQLHVERCEADGRTLATIDVDQHLVDLSNEDWQQARLELRVTVPPELAERLVPEAEREAPPLDLLLVVRCPRTRVRRGFHVTTQPVHPGQHKYPLRLDRRDVAGAVEVLPYLVRCGTNPDEPSGFASHRGARVASARPWEIRVDVEREREGQYLDVRYRRFSEDDQLRPFAANLWRLEIEESPILWINSDHRKIVSVIEDRGTVGQRARLREVVFDQITHAVWTQLFVRSVQDLHEEDEPTYRWQEGVLDELLPALYPAARDRASRLEELRRDLREAGLPKLLADLDAALQGRSRLVDHVGRLVEETMEKDSAPPPAP